MEVISTPERLKLRSSTTEPKIVRKEFEAIVLGSGELKLRVLKVPREKLLESIQPYFHQVFEGRLTEVEQQYSLFSASGENQERFNSMFSESYLWYVGDEFAGWISSDIVDWNTLYLRNGGVLPAFRRRGLFRLFVSDYIPYVFNALGFNFIFAHTAPNNFGILRTLLGFEFEIAGFHMRYGRVPYVELLLKKSHLST